MGAEVNEIFPLQAKRSRGSLAKKILWRLAGRYHRGDRDPDYLTAFAQEAEARMRGKEYDIIFSPGSEVLAKLRSARPITFCADATFANLVDYYWDFSRTSPEYLRYGHAQEAEALKRASLAVYPSEWAARSAIEVYGMDPKRVEIIPFGANLGSCNEREQVNQWIDDRASDRVRLVFVGRDWKRKGGDIVISAARSLISRGLRVELDLVGCEIPREFRSIPWIKAHGLLRANVSSEQLKLSALFAQAHFVFVPSRAEAYGMTFAEANAFGVPAIATATGGIPSIVRQGVNGFLLPLNADGPAYAGVIAQAFRNRNAYRELAKNSFNEFDHRLNWRVFCSRYLEAVARTCDIKVYPKKHPKSPPVRVAFVINRYYDSSTQIAWSGLPYFIRNCLEKAGIEIVDCMLEDSPSAGPLIRHGFRRLLGRGSVRGCDQALLKGYARQLEQRLESLNVDAIFSPSSWLIAHLQTKLPIFFWTDACFAGMLNFYASFSRLSPANIRDGHEAEHRALSRCAGAFYSSSWAAQTAIRHYGSDPEKIRVIPFGANIHTRPTAAEVEHFIEQRPHDHCELVLVGVDWKRKGVTHAIATVEEIIGRNHSVRLTVVGCAPPRGTHLPDCVNVIPFIRKDTREGQKLLTDIYARSHFFIMPSRAEAYGLVFAEANAFGLPCLATGIGGIPSIITNGANGQLFSADAGPQHYADYIVGLMNDIPRYRQLARQSAQEARARLNWDVSGELVAAELKKVIERRKTDLAHAAFPPSPHHVSA